ncbi:MAG: bifunctional 4-hydroxy-2-oxoglutarate aldolase/2-dehydro-3-deoxy-phosphogluconate aldolase [Bacteroidetes bacterium]|jgi:2-dehydro-3-deoxyphosphogluconate aldolase / (4S)-4-hydroxy-2-oxoglutarate aldolase|uniref:bifunctional 4-hydroxy-2-oxoglutarate aldolase/2-dehydro-3-deoxy-phosphogluconate aldolase n=1 Tax=Daejeonella sp. TaxID=2805397 RepID=UPI004049BBBA|nr:bifunctional 4-hydroxy-2-oxoglutarate aldolase/2-dehydro-3-deoxy-phosphogluconate aldolase [Bacteroidota bacterium]
MNNQEFSWNGFSKVPIVGIIRNLSFDTIEKILPIYLSAGLTTIEITMNTQAAAEIIRFAADKYKGQLNVGAGTVCNTDDLDLAIKAGSQFIVTPILDPDVVRTCVSENIPVFPGAYTPTEIYQAWKLGASMVKVYPATSLGPEYIKDVKAPLTNIKLMPTGGINLDNIQTFIKAGADGLGIGSQLFDKILIKDENWQGLELHFKQYVSKLNS